MLPSFLNAGLFMAGLGAVSVPIIIHLLNRRRFKVLHWAAMDFLLEAARMNRKRVQIEHLLVLLLRCLAVFLIVAAVARPVSTSSALSKLPGARDHVERILILDDSASTGEKEGDKTAFDQGKKLVADLIDDLQRERPGDLVTIIRGSRARHADLVRSEAKSGRTDELKRRIEGWKPSDTRFKLAPCIAEALASRDEKTDKSALKRYVYVLTDLRKVDWEETGGDKESEVKGIHDVMRQGGKDTQFIMVDVGHSDTTNVGIVDLRPQEPLVTTGIPQKIVARIKNYGASSVHEVRLELQVGPSSLPVAPVPEIKAGETKDVEITYTFADAGPYAATVRLEGDRFPADDRRDVALEVVRAIRVLLVDGKPTDEPYESQTYFLEHALNPSGEVKSGVEAVSIPIERLGEEDLSSYHAVILCDVDQYPAGKLPALYRYLYEGGGLAIFLGDDVTPGEYELGLWKKKVKRKNGEEVLRDGRGPLPCRLGDLREQKQPVRLSAPALDHPLLRVFSGENNPFLSRVKSRKHFACPVDGTKDPTTRVIARWEDVEGSPAILEKTWKLGQQGRVLLFNTTASRAWTDWPREMSFPVIAQELVRYLAPSSTQGHNLTVGQSIVRLINPALTEPKAKLFVPGEKQPHELLASVPPKAKKAPGAPEDDDEDDDTSDALAFQFDDTVTAGVYQLELTPRASGSVPRIESYAVELDPKESELAKLGKDETDRLKKSFETDVNIRFEVAAPLLPLTEGERSELWRFCAFALLAVLAAEGILSFIAAHHGSAASQEEVEAARRGREQATAPVSLPVADDRPSALPIAGAK